MNIKDYKLWVFITLFAIMIALFITHTTPRMIINGSEEEYTEVNEKYKDKGAYLQYFFKKVNAKVEIKNKVNVHKLGTYKITYETVYKKQKIKNSRMVHVVDRKAPTIKLKGDGKVTVCPRGHYHEEGYEVIDNYDKDLEKKVKVDENQFRWIYSVKDSSGNEAKAIRTFVFEDKTPPILGLTMGDKVTVYQNDPYEDFGYRAVDNCDNDVTSRVQVTGKVDTTKLGTYKITYKATDLSANEVIKERTVEVVEKPKAQDKRIYLTFDDGPSASITPKILDILKEEKVKATFFVINKPTSLDYLIKRAHDEGHTVGLHSYTHNYAKIYANTTAYFDDLNKIQEKVNRIIGKKVTIIRFPGGSSNTISKKYSPGIMSLLTRQVENRGFHYFDWNVGSGDSGNAHTKEEVYTNVVRNLTKKDNIVLMHDFEGNQKTLDALRDIIRYGKENGFAFASLSENSFKAHHGVNN